MNLRKSLNIALAMSDKNRAWLLNEIDMSPSQMTNILRADSVSTKTIKRISDAFEMSMSEFIKLGEDEK